MKIWMIRNKLNGLFAQGAWYKHWVKQDDARIYRKIGPAKGYISRNLLPKTTLVNGEPMITPPKMLDGAENVEIVEFVLKEYCYKPRKAKALKQENTQTTGVDNVQQTQSPLQEESNQRGSEEAGGQVDSTTGRVVDGSSVQVEANG